MMSVAAVAGGFAIAESVVNILFDVFASVPQVENWVNRMMYTQDINDILRSVPAKIREIEDGKYGEEAYSKLMANQNRVNDAIEKLNSIRMPRETQATKPVIDEYKKKMRDRAKEAKETLSSTEKEYAEALKHDRKADARINSLYQAQALAASEKSNPSVGTVRTLQQMVEKG